MLVDENAWMKWKIGRVVVKKLSFLIREYNFTGAVIDINRFRYFLDIILSMLIDVSSKR